MSLMPFIVTGLKLWDDGKIANPLSIWRDGSLLWPRGELLL